MKLFSILTVLLLSTAAFGFDSIPEKPVEHGNIDFGWVPYNSSRTQTLTLTNNGENPITDISARISGDFSLRHNCPKELNVGESCRAKVSMWATRAGAHWGRLTVYTSVKDYIYNLSGTAERDPFPPNYPPIPNPPMPPRP